MRSPLRNITVATAVALALPLLATATPASATQPTVFREKGLLGQVWFQAAETSEELVGNYVDGSIDLRGDAADGFLDTFWCDEGETPYGDEETGDNACEAAGAYFLQGSGLTTSSGGGKRAARARTYSGDIDFYDASVEDATDPVLQDVPLKLTFTPTGEPARYMFNSKIRDPVSGFYLMSHEKETSSPAAVAGTVGSIKVGPDAEGRVGTYARRTMERVG